MDDSYYVILCSEHGGTSLFRFSKEELEEKLNSNYFGETTKVFVDQDLDKFTIDLQTSFGLYIIKGQMVAPKQVVTWEI